jgi:hypothetical protein
MTRVAACLYSRPTGRGRFFSSIPSSGSMKQFLVTLIAVLVGGFLALLAYDRFIVQSRPGGTSPTASETATTAQAPATVAVSPERPASAASQSPATIPGVEVGAAVPLERVPRNRTELVADAVQRATMFRVALTEYYQTNLRWPQDADEAGLPAPEEMRGGAVRSVGIGPGGTVTIVLDPPFIAGSRVELTPRVTSSGQVEWGCRTQGDPGLADDLPRCDR